jgi:hypothetical protein
MNKIHFIILFLLVSAATLGHAQTKDLPSEQVQVIKSFDARLADAEKFNTAAAALDVDTAVAPQRYQLDIPTTRLDYDPPRLRPLAMSREKVPEQYKTFLKAGYGIPAGPYIQGGTHFQQAEQFDANLGFLHHGARSNKVENQRFSRTRVALDGNYHIPDRFSVQGDIGFQQEGVSLYGYNQEDTTFTKEEARQRFNRFHMGLAAYNTSSNRAGLDYRAGISFYGMNDNFDSRENGLNLELALIKWFADSHPLRVTIGHQYAGFKDTISKPLNNFYIRPSFTFHGEAFRFKAGMVLLSNGDNFTYLPDLEFLISLAGNAFAVYAGWGGDFYQNNMDNLSRYNPFIMTQFNPVTTTYHDIYAGVKGAASGWNYQAQVGVKQIRDLALFLPDSADSRRFNVLYDTARSFYISGSAGLELMSGLDFTGTLLQNIYSLNNQERAWHLPGIEANANLQYQLLQNKLILRGDLFLANGVSYQQADESPDRLGALLDLSFGANYQMMKNLGIWLQVNNLTNNTRERWQRYPTFGTNVLGGVLLRF